jgi:hypothetical protein
MNETRCTILIVGGGTGGCAAAMAAAEIAGASPTHGRVPVILSEETDWLGGQLTTQAVPPDEHPWIESHGCTRRYRAYRDGVRQYYRDHYPLTDAAKSDNQLNPGNGRVSQLCHEPRAGVAVIERMLATPRRTGALEVRLRRKPVAVETDGDRVRAVELLHLDTGEKETIQAEFVLDATELGDLLPLAGVEYVTGAESQAETGEPHAPPQAQPGNVQAITWCFPMAHDPQREHVMDKPAQYERWRNYVPKLRPPWPGKLLDPVDVHPITLQPRRLPLFPDPADLAGPSWWTYRRIVCRDHYPAKKAPHEVTLVNWPHNDYFEGNLIDQPDDVVARCLEESRQLSLSLLYWLQTEAPRTDGGLGYPGLYLRPDLVGTSDGLAKAPYIRESRRINAVFTVTENHVGCEARGGYDIHSGKPKPATVRANVAAEQFPDSVGIGYYRIDLHPSTGGDNYIDIASLPFQIPLGALLPVRVENLLPACKNLGVTHITNGCYRLHPVEWNIGESAGLLAAFCLERKLLPRQVRADRNRLDEFQRLLRRQGIELAWPSP